LVSIQDSTRGQKKKTHICRWQWVLHSYGTICLLGQKYCSTSLHEISVIVEVVFICYMLRENKFLTSCICKRLQVQGKCLVDLLIRKKRRQERCRLTFCIAEVLPLSLVYHEPKLTFLPLLKHGQCGDATAPSKQQMQCLQPYSARTILSSFYFFERYKKHFITMDKGTSAVQVYLSLKLFCCDPWKKEVFYCATMGRAISMQHHQP
jgi:hypothetical protein